MHSVKDNIFLYNLITLKNLTNPYPRIHTIRARFNQFYRKINYGNLYIFFYL